MDKGPLHLEIASLNNKLNEKIQELQTSNERFINLIEVSPLAIEILSPDGKIKQVNSEWRKLWNVSEEDSAEVLEKYNMLADPQLIDLGVVDMVKKAFSGERVILPPIKYSADQVVEDFGLENIEELRIPWFQCHLSPIKNSNGDVVNIINIYVDITELKKAEEKSNQHRKILAQMNRINRMGQLTASIAHELNQPLTGILSSAQAAELMIKSGTLEVEELNEILTDIINDAKRGGDVIHNLSEMYRKKKVEFEPFNLFETINDTIKLLHSELILKNIVIHIKKNRSIPTLNCNKIQIQQVLVNLIMNAIQSLENSYSDSHHIQIQTVNGNNEICTNVLDDGIGIDPDKIDYIFEPLSSLKQEDKGIGLSICNSIIKSHGGRMWAKNRPEGGAVVGFSLPLP